MNPIAASGALGADQSTIVSIVACVIAATSLIVAVSAQLRLTRVRWALRVLRGHSGDGDVLDIAVRHAAEVSLLREQVEQQQAELDVVRRDVAAALRHVAVVRYDAFDDLGGRLSFSVALLDDAGHGVVLTSIHGRGETRSYAKGLVGGPRPPVLSPEEQQAVIAARSATTGRSPARPATGYQRDLTRDQPAPSANGSDVMRETTIESALFIDLTQPADLRRA